MKIVDIWKYIYALFSWLTHVNFFGLFGLLIFLPLSKEKWKCISRVVFDVHITWFLPYYTLRSTESTDHVFKHCIPMVLDFSSLNIQYPVWFYLFPPLIFLYILHSLLCFFLSAGLGIHLHFLDADRGFY